MANLTLVYVKSHNKLTKQLGVTMFEIDNAQFDSEDEKQELIKQQVNEAFISYANAKVVVIDEVKVYEADLINVHKDFIQ